MVGGVLLFFYSRVEAVRGPEIWKHQWNRHQQERKGTTAFGRAHAAPGGARARPRPRTALCPAGGPGPPESSYAGALAQVHPEMSPLFICPLYAFAKSVLLFDKFLHLVLNLQNGNSSKYKWN